MIRPSFNSRFGTQASTNKVFQFVSTPTCQTCRGQTIGEHGEQCRVCLGAGFLTYRGGQGVGRAMEKRP